MSENEIFDPFAEDFEIDEADAEEIPYPVCQWYTGRGKGFESLHPVIAHGGFELPLDTFGNLVDNGKYTIAEIPHKNSTEIGYLIPELHLSILAKRYTWRIRGESGWINLGKRYEDGATKRTQYLCLIKEFGPTPVIFTIKGMSGKHLEAVIKEHLKQVIVVARKLGNDKKFPQNHFWLSLKAGPPTEAGRGDDVSTITPPMGTWDHDLFISGDIEKCRQPARDLYVGPGFLKVIYELKNEADEWAKRWDITPTGDDNDQAPATNGNDNPPPTVDPQAHFYYLCAQNGIDLSIAQEALIRANHDYMVALTLLPMKQVNAIQAMNPPEDNEPAEKAF